MPQLAFLFEWAMLPHETEGTHISKRVEGFKGDGIGFNDSSIVAAFFNLWSF